jgi:protein involved in temperature-dependent protein secretion
MEKIFKKVVHPKKIKADYFRGMATPDVPKRSSPLWIP